MIKTKTIPFPQNRFQIGNLFPSSLTNKEIEKIKAIVERVRNFSPDGKKFMDAAIRAIKITAK
jgi:hypothetical protein